MIRIANPGARREYVLREDRKNKKASQTVFVLRRLTWEEMQEWVSMSPIPLDAHFEIAALNERLLNEGTVGDDGERIPRRMTSEEESRLRELIGDPVENARAQTQQMAEAVIMGCESIRNLVDEDGHPVDMSVEDFVRLTTTDRVLELGEAIIDYSRAAPGLAKK